MANMTTQEILQGIKDWAAPKVIYDISAAHNNTKYTDLADALGTNGGNIPQEYKKGGITVRFVHTSDNKYVQYRLIANSFTTDVTKWQGVDSEPTDKSINLVESGGVYNSIKSITGADIVYSFSKNASSQADINYTVLDQSSPYHAEAINIQAGNRINIHLTDSSNIISDLQKFEFILLDSEGNTILSSKFSSDLENYLLEQEMAYISIYCPKAYIENAGTISISVLYHQYGSIEVIEEEIRELQTVSSENSEDIYTLIGHTYENNINVDTHIGKDINLTGLVHEDKYSVRSFPIPANTETLIGLTDSDSAISDHSKLSLLLYDSNKTKLYTNSFTNNTISIYSNTDIAYIGLYCKKDYIAKNSSISIGSSYNEEGVVQHLEDVVESHEIVLGEKKHVLITKNVSPSADINTSLISIADSLVVPIGTKVRVSIEDEDGVISTNGLYWNIYPFSETQETKNPVSTFNANGVASYSKAFTIRGGLSGEIIMPINIDHIGFYLKRYFITKAGTIKFVFDWDEGGILSKPINFTPITDVSKTILYVGDSISTGYQWMSYISDDYGLSRLLNNDSFPASAGGTPLIPVENELSGQESIWWRCANHRLLNAGYNPNIISIFGGANDLAPDVIGSLDLGSVTDLALVDDSDDFESGTTIDIQGGFPENVTFCQALKGCILMLQRDFSDVEVIIPTILYSSRGLNVREGETLCVAENMAKLQVSIAQLYDLKFVPWYWSERNVNTLDIFSIDGLHPNKAGSRLMEIWFAKYLGL